MNDMETALRVSRILNTLSWLVVLVGVVNAIAVVIAGYNVVEPWAIGGYVVDEDWKSVLGSFLLAGGILVVTAVQWALIQAARLVVRYVGDRPVLPE
jgi:hypothetical protein